MNQFITIPSMILLAFFVSGCAVGPLVLHEAGRTVGKSKHELTAGYGQAGAVGKWNYGVSDNFDVGLQYESFSLGLRAKYALIHGKQRGFSMALAAGTGASIGGSHYYGDLITSYFASWFEPYAAIRYVHVNADPVEFKDKDTGNVDFRFTVGEYDYLHYFVGTRLWFGRAVFLSLEGSALAPTSSGLTIGNSGLVGGALGVRF